MVRFKGNAFNESLIGTSGSLSADTTANCIASLTGFLADDGASHIGLAYTLGNVGIDRQIDGTAALGLVDAAAPVTVDLPTYGTVKLKAPVVTETRARWRHGSTAPKTELKTLPSPATTEILVDPNQPIVPT
jgi:hypothetical protein